MLCHFASMDTGQTVVVAEDDVDDALLVQRAFKSLGLLRPIRILTDGDEVISYLKGGDLYADRTQFPFPNILLLDLKMPKVSGFEVLAFINQNPRPARDSGRGVEFLLRRARREESLLPGRSRLPLQARELRGIHGCLALPCLLLGPLPSSLAGAPGAHLRLVGKIPSHARLAAVVR